MTARRCLALSLAWFTALVLIVLFGRGWIRGSFGDLAVVPWVIHSLGVLPPLTDWTRTRVAAGLGLATTLECIQLLNLVTPEDPQWMHLIFGSTFDPLDLAHYVVGAAIAWMLERAWSSHE